MRGQTLAGATTALSHTTPSHSYASTPLTGSAALPCPIAPRRFSRASYVYSLFRPHIVADLGLQERGLKLLPRVPSSWTPSMEAGGPTLTLGAGQAADEASIAALCPRDVPAYRAFNAKLDRYGALVRALMDAPPPNPAALFSGSGPAAPTSGGWLHRARDVASLFRTGGTAVAALGADLPAALEFAATPAARLLDATFDSELLKATLAVDAVIGSMASPFHPSTAYVLLHHCLFGAWYNVQGGMGALSATLESAAREAGATMLPATRIRQFVVDSGDGGARVGGVRLEDGNVLTARAVLATMAPTVALYRLLPEAATLLPPDIVRNLRSVDESCGVMKINLALAALPRFTSAPASGGASHLHGTVHLEDHMSQLHEAYVDAAGGMPSSRPIVELTVPSTVDPSLAPHGAHVCLLFVQHVPYAPSRWPQAMQADMDAMPLTHRTWANPAVKHLYARRVVYPLIDRFAPGFSATIVGEDVLSPWDLETVFGLPRGNIFHAAMPIHQLLWMRPVPGLAHYRVPIAGRTGSLYLGGAGCHPGGGVMGAPGFNAAMTLLRDWGMTGAALRRLTSAAV